ncbi:GNAT family N-acetyltransferase [Thiomonas sp.]|uniref:GNAT family N-acetyltransferase n=1 Tax=Thiomonas sp. TaxID=2047785 RepID=UPI002605D7CF|nr:GNAT family N-acetyltransferase [Thiomonas sp.]
MITLTDVDLSLPEHADAVTGLISRYARDPMGGGQDLAADVKAVLVQRLRARSDYVGVLAFDGAAAVGLVNCFEGFSTFLAKPLMNVHDVYVEPEYRGQGLSRRMLQRVEHIARARGCGKLTLEVLDGNLPAISSYRRFGFETYALDPAYGRAQFWQKKL